MSVYIQHLGSEISRIFGSSVSLSRFKRSSTNKKRRSTCFVRPRPIFACCEIVAVLSECGANSFATAQMKSPSHAPLPGAYPSASADDIAGDPCVRLQVVIVQPPRCATPADVDLRSSLSVALSIDHHLQRVDILPGFQLHCLIARAHETSADALLPSHVSSGRISHSSGTFLDTELNAWAFSGEEHQFANNRTVLTVFSWTKQRFSSGTFGSDRTPGECTRLQLSKPALDNRLSKRFASGLTRKSPFRLGQHSPEDLSPTLAVDNSLSTGRSGPWQSESCAELHRDQPIHIVHVFAHHDIRES